MRPELYLREPLELEALSERLLFTRLDDGSAVPFDLEVIDGESVRVVPRSALGFWQSYSLALETSEVGCRGVSGVFSTVAPELLPPPLRTAAALKLARKGDVVYSTSPTFHGLQVHRLTGTQLQLLGDLHWPAASNAIELLDERAYVPAGAGGVVILDVSQAGAPRVLGSAGVPGNAADVAPFRNAGRELLAVAAGTAGVVIVDVTEPEASSIVAELALSGTGSVGAQDVDLEGELLAVATGLNGTYTLNLADPAQPVLLGHSPDPAAPRHEPAVRFPSGEAHACRSLRAHPSEPLLYMSDLSSLVVYGVDDGGEVTAVAEVPLPSGGSMGALALAGERLIAATSSRDFAAGSPGGISPRLQLFDLGDPRAPRSVWRSEPLEGSLTTLSVLGQKLFAGGGTKVTLFDLSGIEPELEGTVQTQSVIRQLLATPEAVYVAQSTGGLAVLRTGALEAPPGEPSLPPPVLR